MAGTFGKVVKGTVILVVIGAAVAAGALGIWDWRKTARSLKTVGGNVAHKVGDMEVTVGKPLGNAADAEACRANLRRIDTAKRVLADRAGGIAFRDVTWEAVLGAMNAQAKPKCPCGGTYILGTMQELPRCSVGANNSREAKMHHMIR
jgi:hypothetical protein